MELSDECRMSVSDEEELRKYGTWPAVCGLWRTGGGDLEKEGFVCRMSNTGMYQRLGFALFFKWIPVPSSSILLFFFLKVISDGNFGRQVVAKWSQKIYIFFFKSHLFFSDWGVHCPPLPLAGSATVHPHIDLT